MFDVKLGITLAGGLLLVALGCQQAEQPSPQTGGPTDDSTSEVAETEDQGGPVEDVIVQESVIPESPAEATVPDAGTPKGETVVAAKITPPAVDPSTVVPDEPPKPLTIGDPAPPLSIATWVDRDTGRYV